MSLPEVPLSKTIKPKGLISFFASHYNAANLLMIIMILFGVVGLKYINTQVFPDVTSDTVSISIKWSGATAEDVESNILQVVEPEVRFLDGVKDMTSYAREGAASISLTYDEGMDMQTALSDVEKALDSISLLPESAEDPEVSFSRWRDRIARIALSGPFTERALRNYAYQIRDELLNAGMTSVSFQGLRSEEIEIAIKEPELVKLNMTIQEVAAKISGARIDLPSGTLEGQVERKLRAVGDSRDLETYKAIEVLARPDGSRVTLGQIADIQMILDPDATSIYLNRNPTIVLNTERSRNEDTLAAAAIMDKTIAQIKPTLPESLNIIVYDRRSDRVVDRIMLLVKNGLSGLIIVLAVLFIFLNFRIAFWVSAGIPVAFMATLGFMWVMGQSINMMTLFALLMMLGIIVDDAIVVGEHTATRLSLGDDPKTAAINGGTHMAIPVIAAILTTQAAFGPLLLVQDTMGQIIEALPMVALAVLMASLIESLLILPGHLRHAGKKVNLKPSGFRRNFDKGFEWFKNKPFHYLVSKSYRFRYVTMVLSITLLVAISAGLLKSKDVRFVFFPSPEPESITANISFAPGTSRETVRDALFEIADVAKEVEKELLEKAHQENATPQQQKGDLGGGIFDWLEARVDSVALAVFGVEFYPDYIKDEKLISRIMVNVGEAGRDRGANFGEIELELVPSELRSVLSKDITSLWRARAPQPVGMDSLTIRPPRFGPPGRDFELELSGASPAILKTAAEEVAQSLSAFPGANSISDSLPYGDEEILIELTLKGRALGFTTQSVGTQLRDAFEGRIAKRFSTSNDEIAVRVRMDTDGLTLAGLKNLQLRSPDGKQVPLSEVASLSEKRGFSVIIKEDGKTTVTLSADIDRAQNDPDDIIKDLNENVLPFIASKYGLNYDFAGRSAERAQAFKDVGTGGMVAAALIYLILALVFSSYLRPFAVMFIIPFGLLGAVLGHALTGFDMSIMSVFGLLGLAGILVNDSIILVKRIDERLEEGDDLATAAIGGSKDRLRAVLLTSLTTIGGLAPLLFEKSLQAQFLIPMAITLVFGLGVATLFVLFLIPSLLGIGRDVKNSVLWILQMPRLDGAQKQA